MYEEGDWSGGEFKSGTMYIITSVILLKYCSSVFIMAIEFWLSIKLLLIFFLVAAKILLND